MACCVAAFMRTPPEESAAMAELAVVFDNTCKKRQRNSFSFTHFWFHVPRSDKLSDKPTFLCALRI